MAIVGSVRESDRAMNPCCCRLVFGECHCFVSDEFWRMKKKTITTQLCFSLVSIIMRSQLMRANYLIPGSLECDRLLLSCCRLPKSRCDWFRICCWTIGDCCALNVARLIFCRFWFMDELCCCCWWWWISFILLLWLLLSNRFWARGQRIVELLWISWRWSSRINY